MAKKFIDASAHSEPSALAIQDGTALTLTNKVRILFDSSVSNASLVAALRKVEDAINLKTG